MHRLLACLVLSLLLAHCGKGECEPGLTRACYSGPAATRGIGICHDGVQTCGEDGAWLGTCPGEQVPSDELCDGADDDCNGKVDEGVKNVCGGCAPLDGKPGDACPGCGHLACNGTESLKCVAPANTVGDPCREDDCPGRYACQQGEVVCQATKKNACGVCGGPVVTGIGDTCTDNDGCEGLKTCNIVGTALVCDGPKKNTCGVCGIPDVANVGDTCTGQNGCPGGYVCNESGDGALCDAQPKNQCDKCGGPPVTGLGDACGQGACAGTLACNDTGDAAVCNFPGRGDACTGPDGCGGKVVCGQDGETTTCNAPTKNLCGVCGGPAITGNIGDACTVGSCNGVLQCSAAGDKLSCIPDPSCLPQTTHVVLSELSSIGPKGTRDEFIELYNPTASDVSLSGWKLWYRNDSATGNINEFHAFTSGAKIAAHGYYLVAGAATASNGGYSDQVVPDAHATGTIQDMANTNGGTVLLTKTTSKPTSVTAANVVDSLGWGSCRTPDFGEGGTCAPTHPASPGSIERKARPTSDATTMAPGGIDENSGNGQDSDKNADDFVARAIRNPQSSASGTEP